MRTRKNTFILIITLIMVLVSTTCVSFADINYNEWDSLSSYPSDVINTPYFTSVKYLVDKKIMTGYPDGTFRLDGLITRAEMAVAVTKMTNRTSSVELMANKNVFTDLVGYDWAKGHINTLVDANIIKGISETTYAPAKNISYAELVTMLIRTRSGAASELESYGTWPNNYIQYAQMYNMLGDVVVADWTAPATRGDTAKLIYRMAPKTTTAAIGVDIVGVK